MFWSEHGSTAMNHRPTVDVPVYVALPWKNGRKGITSLDGLFRIYRSIILVFVVLFCIACGPVAIPIRVHILGVPVLGCSLRFPFVLVHVEILLAVIASVECFYVRSCLCISCKWLKTKTL